MPHTTQESMTQLRESGNTVVTVMTFRGNDNGIQQKNYVTLKY